MENLFERFHRAIGQDTSRLDKKASHFSLPTFIDFAASHASTSAFKVLRFEVPDQQSIWTQEQRVVVPSCLAQSRQHLWPHAAVAGLVFIQAFRFYLQNEANTFHVLNPKTSCPPSSKQFFYVPALPQISLTKPTINGNHVSGRFCALLARQPDDRTGTVLRENGAPGERSLCVEVS